MKRRLLLALLACGSCRDENIRSHPFAPDPGWSYSWNGSRPELAYGLIDRERSTFRGDCDGSPVFFLSQGDYGEKVARFQVSKGAWSQTFHAFQGVESRGLFLVDDGADFHAGSLRPALHLAQARGPITITTDDGWTRTIPSDPLIARFVSDCLWFIKTYPYPPGPPEWQERRSAALR